MGFNPNRVYKKKPADVVLVVITLLLTLALVLWAILS
jgi:hypothetical protein